MASLAICSFRNAPLVCRSKKATGAIVLSAADFSLLIGLVRAALLDPAVRVLDEATADIDPATAHTPETAIDALRADRTLVVIAHREATVRRLPRIIRLDDNALLPQD
ncbi:hypothetical protein ABZ702_27005 [Streptomyces cyaneofuscatus]|uniref:hypothetical protein n=1 Tax=Streptomyces cyaneofuscatus TaxID=66883 RepID=UPI0033C398FA